MNDFNEIDDVAGERFGRWIAIEPAGTDRNQQRIWLCECSCGTERAVRLSDLKSGKSASCGCVSAEKASLDPPNLRHGHRSGGKSTPTYVVWREIVRRCCDEGARSYVHYGALGVAIADEWLDFEIFLEAVGEAPSAKHTLERIDPELDYEPGNVRWRRRRRTGPRPPKRRRRRVGKRWLWRGRWRTG